MTDRPAEWCSECGRVTKRTRKSGRCRTCVGRQAAATRMGVRVEDMPRVGAAAAKARPWTRGEPGTQTWMEEHDRPACIEDYCPYDARSCGHCRKSGRGRGRKAGEV